VQRRLSKRTTRVSLARNSSTAAILKYEPESYEAIFSKEPVAEGEGDVPSASISTHKGSRYSEVLSKLALTERTNLPFVSSTRSTLPERPKSPVKILPDQALAHPPTIQVHINNGKVEDDVLGGIHKGVKGAVRYGIFPRSLKVYILEV
jgi:hypothetical protein